MRVIQGIEVHSDTLAIEVPRRVDPNGHFVSNYHICEYICTEYFIPCFADQNVTQTWVKMVDKDTV